MQLHPPTFSVPWHSGGDNSELSMPLGHLPRHYSTDRSSSLGSMESLENPSSQGYYDNQLSPIDPAIFNNKRDSAYSSFSASSNTSDYTVSLRPEENSSMDSLLQGLGPSCRFAEGRPNSATSGPGELHCEEGNLKSRSLPHRSMAKARPSSCSYEEEKCGPPQPPMRKESFRATRGRPGVTDKRCVSAPVGIPNMTCCMIESPPHVHEGLNGGGCLNDAQENGQNLKGNSTEPYYTFSSQRELCINRQDESTEYEQSSHLQPLERLSSRPSPPSESSDAQLSHLENNLPSRMHRHSAPEKLLASQLHMMELSNDNNEHISSSNLWSRPVHPSEDLRENSPDIAAQGKWGGSRCSTPGSLTTSEIEDQRVEEEPFDSGQGPSPIKHSWGRSASVPGEPARNGLSGSSSSIDTELLERDFGLISAAASMDTLLEEDHERGGGGTGDEAEVSKPPQKRQFRSSKSRRRSERFATNLRNEIQRKKAQLQKSKGPDGILCGGDTVEEEDGANLHMEEEEESASEPPLNRQPTSQTKSSNHISFQNTAFAPSPARRTASNSPFQQDLDKSCGINLVEHSRTRTEDTPVSQHDFPAVPSTEVTRPVAGHVVEEVAPPGKARRWRWTPEHKLQPEMELAEKKSAEGTGPLPLKLGTTRGRMGSSSGRSSRTEDCDIPPFADRRKFFEETIRNLSQSVTNLASLTSRRQRPEKQGRKDDPSSPDPHQSVLDLGRRRFSYQGGVHDGTSRSSLETRKQIGNAQQERDREREKMMEREWEKEKKREREQERLQEQKRLQAWEKEQRDKEQEREQEKARNKAEREQQRPQLMERKWETEKDVMYAGHDLSNTIMPPPLPHSSHLKQSLPSQNVAPNSCHLDVSHSEISPETQKPCSAFRPVMSQQYQSDHHCLHPGYKARSYTPTEAYPVREMEQTKLNRKFSLTERDYAPRRRDSRPVEVPIGLDVRGQWNRPRFSNNEDQPFKSSLLRNRAMSENDLRMETHYLQNHIAANANTNRMASSTLPKLDENVTSVDEAKKKKGPPPPRPPPPKWGQFYKRRASHHNLFSSPPAFSPQMQTYPPHPPIVYEMSRQRSYSLPPRDGTESCQQCYQECPVAPPSPAFNRRAFKPVALPPKERETPISHHYDIADIPPPLAESNTRLPDQSWALPSDQYRSAVVKPVFHKHRAEWDLTGPHNSTTNSTSRSSEPAPAWGNGSYLGAVSPESYFTMNNNNNYQHHFHNHPQQVSFPLESLKSLEHSVQTPPQGQDHVLPIETDIDEVTENEDTAAEQQRQEEGRMEMQCFAQPVMVLETDIDTLTDEEAFKAGMRRAQRTSLVDSLLEKDCGRARKELMGELFPQCTEAGSGGEGWRGGYPVSGDTLERSSRQGPSASQGSASTSYSASTNKAQLLKVKDFSEKKEDDEELHYKRQLMESLRKKLGVLREAQRGLQEDIRANAQLGEEVESLVLAVCKPNEVDKFRMFIGDLDKVTSLLLSLSGRLLRVESALDCLDPESGHTERLPLMEKKKQLLAQLAEAQELKEHVDRREQAVGRVLGRCLTPEQLRDYSHFVKMKAALLVEQRQLDDKIRLGEEQLRGLRESLGLGLGVGLTYGH